MNWAEACEAMLEGKSVTVYNPTFDDNFTFCLKSGYLVCRNSNLVLMTEEMFRATTWEIVNKEEEV